MKPESLFNTKFPPPEWKLARLHAHKAKAYHDLSPYPKWGFSNWKTEERGPYPRCWPFPRSIVRRGAQWLFGRPVSFSVAGEEGEERPLTELLNLAIDADRFSQRWASMAELGGQTGSLFLTFDYEKARRPEVCFYVLDGVDHVRLYWDPEQPRRLLMARVQYPVFDAATGKWQFVRTEWTDSQKATYAPKAAPAEWKPGPEPQSESTLLALDESAWDGQQVVTNPFGLIPGVQVQSLDVGGAFGFGDLWGLWQAVDDVNFTYDLAHKDNQLAVRPRDFYIDLKAKAEDAPVAPAPGEAKELASSDPKFQGKIERLSSDAAMRGPISEHAKELLRQLYLAAGSVDVDPEAVTNKGNLTSAVLSQVYAPLIETTERKRNSYGENGLCRLFESMLAGLRNAGVEKFKGVPDDVDVQADWPDFFERTEGEKSERANRHAMLLDKGLTTPEQAAREIHSTEGVSDLDRLVREVKGQPARPERGEEE